MRPNSVFGNSRSMIKIRTACLLGVLIAAWAVPAAAIDDSTKSASRELAREAKRDFDKGHFDDASRKFQKAFAATEVPTLALWSARALVKQGRLVAASAFFRKATELQSNELWVGKAQEQAQQQAAGELAQLLPRLSQLTIMVKGANADDVQVTVDELAVPSSLLGVARPTDPGRRKIVARCGTEEVVQELSLKEGEARQVDLKFEPPSGTAPAAAVAAPATANKTPPLVAAGSAPPNVSVPNQPTNNPQGVSASGKPLADSAQPSAQNAQRALGWVSLGLGAAGIVVGAASGLIVKGRYNDYKPACPNNNCNVDVVNQSKLDSYNTWRTVSTVGFVVGAVGTAAGLTLLLTSPQRASQATVALVVSPASAQVRGSF